MTRERVLDEKWLEYLTLELREELKDEQLIRGKDLEQIIERIYERYKEK